MQSNIAQIKLAISKKAALAKAQEYLRDCLPSEYPTTYGAKFETSNGGKSMTVNMRAIDLTARASGRPIWNGKEWRLQYVFHVDAHDCKVEVFRFYLNDEGVAESSSQEHCGAAEGSDFLNYICSEVFAGTLKSSLFSEAPLDPLLGPLIV